MYEGFYKMKTEAFGSLPSPRIFFKSETHKLGWYYLSSGIKSQEPILLVAGDYGTGKTLLCLTLVNALRKENSFHFTYISTANYSYKKILSEIVATLGLETREEDDFSLQRILYRYFENKGEVKAFYIIIDDIHEFHSSTLNKLRLLANFNHESFFPIRLICFAHSSFLDRLKTPSLRPLDQRIKRKFLLTPFDFMESKEYIYFRLLNSGAPGSPYFPDDTIEGIHSYTGGIPRLINNLCDSCLLMGASRELNVIDNSVLSEAVRALGWEHEDECVKDPSSSDEEEQNTEVGQSGESTSKPTQQEMDFTNIGSTALLGSQTAVLSLKEKMLRAVRFQDEPSLFEKKRFKIIGFLFFLIAAFVVWFFILRGIVATSDDFNFGPKDTQVSQTSEDNVQAGGKKSLDEHSIDNHTKMEDKAVEAETGMPKNNDPLDAAALLDSKAPQGSEKKSMSAAPLSANPVEALPEKTKILSKMPRDIQSGPSPRPYSLILASCRSWKNAQKALDDFRSHGSSPLSLGKVKSGKGGIWWVVYMGYYESEEEAAKARKELKLPDAIVQKTPYCNLVGTFSSKLEMAETYRRLERLGYYPYSIRDEDVYRLLVGAHSTAKKAEAQSLALEADGIQGRVVKR
jgi:type II secretory pathway predicted ATPase ExeA